jgi:hypothetical protein
VTGGTENGWLLLIHQIPPKPDYLRVKTWRRLQRVGAVSIKNSVYVLPNTEQAREDLEWVLREICADGGDGTVCEAKFVDGLRDDQVVALFHAARDAEFEAIVQDAQALQQRRLNTAQASADEIRSLAREVGRLRKRLTDASTLDFFGAPARQAAETGVSGVEQQVKAMSEQGATRGTRAHESEKPTAATWVTRKGIHVDRMASGWLIRRFIDPAAQFKFVPATGYEPEPGELRFDMFDAEYTHEGDKCTFEVLLGRFDLGDPALAALGEIIHDIDLKEKKFGREETTGIDRLIVGIAMANSEDEARLAISASVWDGLYEYFKRKGT